MNKKKPLVAIIILNWNSWRDTLEGLNSVIQISYPNYFTVVVDNGSWDKSLKEIIKWSKGNIFEDFISVEYNRQEALKGGKKEKEKRLDKAQSNRKMVLIRNEKNLGYTGGNNTAIVYALKRQNPADFVFLLNNDAELEKNTLSNLISASEKTSAGVVGCIIKDKNTGKFRVSGFKGFYPLVRQFFQPLSGWKKLSYDPGIECIYSFWVLGTAVLISRDFLADIYSIKGRYLDDRLFLYGEDFELCYQAKEAGYEVVTSMRSIVTHKKAGSSGGKGSPIEFYYSNRNRILIANRVLNLWIKIFFHPFNLLISLGRIFKNLMQGNIKSANAVIWALTDGYLGNSGKWKKHDDFFVKDYNEK